jgi:hypothetical protein
MGTCACGADDPLTFLRDWWFGAEILRLEGALASSLRAEGTCVIIETKVNRRIQIPKYLDANRDIFRNVVVKGLMATCDIIGERSMQAGTYASGSSTVGLNEPVRMGRGHGP